MDTYHIKKLVEPVGLPRAILWVYNHLPEHVTTNPDDCAELEVIEEYLENSGLGDEMK
jgi:hypothetical protein